MADQKFTALIERYFHHPQRMVKLPAGSVVIEQEGYNDRLYYVWSGELSGHYSEKDERKTKVFTASVGAFIGVHSFFFWDVDSIVNCDGRNRRRTCVD